MKPILLGALLAAAAVSLSVTAEEAFPGRALHPSVPVIGLDALRARMDAVDIVDVRSRYEFETLRIAGAHNIPLAGRDFAAQLTALHAASVKPIVFYCNGRTCLKSYQAVVQAHRLGIRDAFAFDAGVFDWARAHPDRAELLGQGPIDPAALIGGERLAAHLLPPAQFSRKAAAGAIVIDVRDRFQREAVSFFPGLEHRVPLDREQELRTHIERAKAEGKPLLVYDAVGKQVQWLQYRLEAAGLKEYYFMEGGARAFYDQLILSADFRLPAH